MTVFNRCYHLTLPSLTLPHTPSHSPFAAVSIGPPSETQGEVKGFSFIYSGNFLFEAELGEIGRLRLNMGVHPMGLSWYLKPGGRVPSLSPLCDPSL